MVETILAIASGLVGILAAIVKFWLNKKSASGSGENYEQYETENEVIQEEINQVEEDIAENNEHLTESTQETEEKIEEVGNAEEVDDIIDDFTDAWNNK